LFRGRHFPKEKGVRMDSSVFTHSPKKSKLEKDKAAFLAQNSNPAQFLTFQAKQISSHLFKTTVGASAEFVKKIHVQTVEIFRKSNFEGFEPNKTPFEYVEELYQSEINNKVKSYILHYWVIDFLFSEVRNHKIHMVNHPRLISIETLSDKIIDYHFNISVSDPIELKEWKNFAFKTPRRKRYKDLDKQVTSFIDFNKIQLKKRSLVLVEPKDWVLLETSLLSDKQKPIAPDLTSYFWLFVDQQEVTTQLVQQLLGKTLNSSITTFHFDYQYNHKYKDDYNYQQLVKVKAILKGSLFLLDTFKLTFKLKNKSEVHNKLMEVFSYRNDVSQRKLIIEEVFHLLLSKHRFEVPKHLILRREENILKKLSKQPDYHVYKSQKSFSTYLEMLAEKQLKEEIIIDHIAYRDNIKSEIKDFEQYLHLFNNKRLNEFIYFKPLWEIDSNSIPVNTMLFGQIVTREKTLNHIINVLTR
jgi:FKBP-type peptidyl-prolyl cis-trans isomerase (trigger factor)